MVWFRAGLAQLGDSSLPLPTLRSPLLPSPNSWWRRRVELGDGRIPVHGVSERHRADDGSARVHCLRGRGDGRVGGGLLVHACSVIVALALFFALCLPSHKLITFINRFPRPDHISLRVH